MRYGRPVYLLALLGLSCLSLAEDRKLSVEWEKGKSVQAVISYPDQKGKVPALVIACGRSGGIQTDLIKDLASQAARQGVAAVRFDYGYFSAKGEPSKSQVDEIAQMKAVVEAVRKDPRIDSKQIVVAGKSLGSVVAYRVFAEDRAILGSILLTPVIPDYDTGQRLYPGLASSYRPVAIIVGNKDPENAPLGAVYNLLRDASSRIAVDVVAGDHGFRVQDADAKLAETRTADAMLAANVAASYWLNEILRTKLPY